MKHFSKKFVISRVFMVKGPEISFVIYRKFVKPRVRRTDRIYKEFVRQNSRDQAFGSLYWDVRYIGILLYI